MRELHGIPVSPGVAIGRVFVLSDTRRPVQSRTLGENEIDAEVERFDSAIAASLEELDALRDTAQDQIGHEAAGIFAFHQGMLRDPSLVGPIRDRIRNDTVPAEVASQDQFKVVAEMFARMADSTFRTKVDDVWDLDHRVRRHLCGEAIETLSMAPPNSVVIANELTPTQTAAFSECNITAFATDTGGETSHTAIFARALGLPAVAGTESLTDIAHTGDTIIVDGDSGIVIINPDKQTTERYEGISQRAQALVDQLKEERELEAVTTDGVPIELLGNIEFAHELEAVHANGGQGVGLFRTEYLWLTSNHEPSEDEQYQEIAEAINRAQGLPVTIRTFDLGADKYTQARALNPERNPFLGLRSIRYCLENVAMFKKHLRAVLRASAIGPIKIMFPLISSMMELRQAKLILRDVMEDLEDEGIAFDAKVPVGMMVEVPSTAITANSFAEEVDFFSIGTNDLIQYTVAVDRGNERIAHLYSPAHPALLKLLREVARAGKKHNINVSCCGEMAGDPLYTMLLLGLGLRTFSATPSRLGYVKRVIRSVDIPLCERLARKAGSFDSDQQVTAFLRDRARKYIPELFGGRTADEPE